MRRIGTMVRVALVALTISAVAAVGVLAAPSTASAHTLDSSSVRLVVGTDGVTGTISLAVSSLDQAFDAAHRSDVLSAADYAAQVTAYVDEHLTVQGGDGIPWTETYSNLVRQTTEGIETVTVDVAADARGADTSDLAVTYDAVIEALPEHQAVLVLEGDTGTVSTPGVFSSSERTIVVGAGSTSVGVADMIRLGFRHVVDGADHLLFLLTLLLPAPLIAGAGRWRRGPGIRPTVRKVVHVVTAFTIGHSLTLVATSLGWVTVPTRPVEVLIAVSVGVSAVHAFRPIVRGGEPVIAAVFGLIHGLAFATILADLGLRGRTSLIALLAFNVGIELAQLAVIACVFPSLYSLLTGRQGGRARIVGAAASLVAALVWALDRLGVTGQTMSGPERVLVEGRWWVVGALAALALGSRLVSSSSPTTRRSVAVARRSPSTVGHPARHS